MLSHCCNSIYDRLLYNRVYGNGNQPKCPTRRESGWFPCRAFSSDYSSGLSRLLRRKATDEFGTVLGKGGKTPEYSMVSPGRNGSSGAGRSVGSGWISSDRSTTGNLQVVLNRMLTIFIRMLFTHNKTPKFFCLTFGVHVMMIPLSLFFFI